METKVKSSYLAAWSDWIRTCELLTHGGLIQFGLKNLADSISFFVYFMIIAD